MIICVRCAKKRQMPERRAVTLVMVGLDNAGKTAVARAIGGADPVPVSEGVAVVHHTLADTEVSLLVLSGSHGVRGPRWAEHYGEAHGLVFVVDAANVKRMPETQLVLAKVLGHPHITAKPVLLLANKQDLLELALGEVDVILHLSLEKLVNEYQCRCLVKPCSAVIGCGQNLDKSIREGLQWLLDYISYYYQDLSERVQKETSAVRAREEERRESAEIIKLNLRERETGRTMGAEEKRESEERDTVEPINKVLSQMKDRANENEREDERRGRRKKDKRKHHAMSAGTNGREIRRIRLTRTSHVDVTGATSDQGQGTTRSSHLSIDPALSPFMRIAEPRPKSPVQPHPET